MVPEAIVGARTSLAVGRLNFSGAIQALQSPVGKEDGKDNEMEHQAEAQEDGTLRLLREEGESDVPSQKIEPEPKKPPAKKKGPVTRFRLVVGISLVLAAVFGWWLYARQFEDTDDAEADGNISAISPRVAGTVIAVHVVDNQSVKAGDLLVELDRNDLEVAVAQAKAAVAQADAAYEAASPNVPITETSNRASLTNADAELANAEADLEAAQRDLDQAVANNRYAQLQRDRGEQLLAATAISQADFDQRSSAADATDAAVKAAKKHVDQRRARLTSAEARLRETRLNTPRQLVARQAELQARKANRDLALAQLKQAELNLGYAGIVAPTAGIVGRKSVNLGDRVQPGQQLVALTQTDDVWVTANFRETQIEHLRIGQSATVHVDAISRDYRGTVESFGGATGSRYSLMPPENATGNYVKVVQRIPVRIQLEPGQPEMDRLRPGMSVEPKVRVR
jgi:membrane fusion protein (multidrug efflux system)